MRGLSLDFNASLYFSVFGFCFSALSSIPPIPFRIVFFIIISIIRAEMCINRINAQRSMYVSLLSVHLPTIRAHFSRLFHYYIIYRALFSCAQVCNCVCCRCCFCSSSAGFWLAGVWLDKLWHFAFNSKYALQYDLKINSQYVGVVHIWNIFFLSSLCKLSEIGGVRLWCA